MAQNVDGKPANLRRIYRHARDVQTLVTVVGCRDWLVDGGEVGHGCGRLHQKLSIVFAGAAATRRLCTPLMDLSHVGSLHFWFSFGNFIFFTA